MRRMGRLGLGLRRAVGFAAAAVWILATGTWNDAGVWDDTDIWNDT